MKYIDKGEVQLTEGSMPVTGKLDSILKSVSEVKKEFPHHTNLADAKDAFLLLDALEQDLKWMKVELYRQWEASIIVKFKT